MSGNGFNYHEQFADRIADIRQPSADPAPAPSGDSGNSGCGSAFGRLAAVIVIGLLARACSGPSRPDPAPMPPIVIVQRSAGS